MVFGLLFYPRESSLQRIPIMENRMEKKMGTEMESRVVKGLSIYLSIYIYIYILRALYIYIYIYIQEPG